MSTMLDDDDVEKNGLMTQSGALLGVRVANMNSDGKM